MFVISRSARPEIEAIKANRPKGAMFPRGRPGLYRPAVLR
jgi:hypothetical protein